MPRATLPIIAVVLAGCMARHPQPPRAQQGLHPLELSSQAKVASALKDQGNVARRVIPVVVALDVYHLTVPQGAISGNRDFWKRIDETKIDVSTYDLLLKNGIRVGLGRDAEWNWFKGILGKYPGARSIRGRTEPGVEGYVEITTRNNVPQQVIMGIDPQGHDWGRRFEECDDILGISFVASSHHLGEALVKVCPIVRGLRRYFQMGILNDEQTHIELAQPQQLYDMRIEARVPMDQFMIVAPSEQSRLPTSLGATFLVTDGKVEPVENVLVIVPRTYRTDEPGRSQESQVSSQE